MKVPLLNLAAQYESIAAGLAGEAAAAALGVSEKSLRDWHKRLAPPPEPCGEDATVDQLRDENKRLRKQLKRAEMEREILKKATAYFAKESLPGTRQ